MWNTDHIETVEVVYLIGQAAQARTVVRRTTNLEELMITNFPEHDDVQWIKHMLP